MPYITPERRDLISCDQCGSPCSALNAGELNYALTWYVNEYMRTHGLSYTTINDIMGAFEGAKLEFYRRVAVPYEDTKITENGDVYNG